MSITQVQLASLYHSVQRLVRGLKVAQGRGQLDGGLNPTDQQVVVHLGEGGPCILGEVADGLGVPLTTASSAVERLEKKGMLVRHRTEQDRRIVRIALTDLGRSVYDEAVREQMRQCQAMLEALDEGERETFVCLMAKIAGAIPSDPRPG